jgi:hypothetical protein
MQILGILGRYFHAVAAEVQKNLLLFKLALVILHSAENGVRYLAKNNKSKKSGENLARNPWNLGK